jgi:hypothetical protein
MGDRGCLRTVRLFSVWHGAGIISTKQMKPSNGRLGTLMSLTTAKGTTLRAETGRGMGVGVTSVAQRHP